MGDIVDCIGPNAGKIATNSAPVGSHHEGSKGRAFGSPLTEGLWVCVWGFSPDILLLCGCTARLTEEKLFAWMQKSRQIIPFWFPGWEHSVQTGLLAWHQKFRRAIYQFDVLLFYLNNLNEEGQDRESFQVMISTTNLNIQIQAKGSKLTL